MVFAIGQVCSIQNLHAYDMALGRVPGPNVGASCCRYSPVIHYPEVGCNMQQVPCYGTQDRWAKAQHCIVLNDDHKMKGGKYRSLSHP